MDNKLYVFKTKHNIKKLQNKKKQPAQVRIFALKTKIYMKCFTFWKAFKNEVKIWNTNEVKGFIHICKENFGVSGATFNKALNEQLKGVEDMNGF